MTVLYVLHSSELLRTAQMQHCGILVLHFKIMIAVQPLLFTKICDLYRLCYLFIYSKKKDYYLLWSNHQITGAGLVGILLFTVSSQSPASNISKVLVICQVWH